MFGSGHTYFAGSPVVINIDGLEWPGNSPFNIVRVYVYYNSKKVGEFPVDTGGQSSISLDISSALRAIWADYDFSSEVSAAEDHSTSSRSYRSYSLEVLTEYLDSQDGEFTQTSSGIFSGGQCALGGFTEWERSLAGRDRKSVV